MKEMVMTTRLHGTWEHTRPVQVVGWLKRLVGRADRLLVYMPAAGGLQCWLCADGAGSRAGVEWWRRLAFRPLHGRRLPAADGCMAGVEWEIAVDCLPPVCLYRAEGLAALLCRGMVPQLVALDGEVLPMEGLTRQQLRRSGTAFAVLDRDLAQRLGLGLPASCFAASSAASGTPASDFSAASGSFAAGWSETPERLMRQVEDCLQRLFSGGAGAVGDCPLKVSPQLRQVPPEHIYRVPDALRTLQFADGGTSLSAAHGWEAYGLYRPSSHRHHRLVMLYPQGTLEETRRFFRFLCGQSMQLPLWWESDESRWAAYDPGPEAFRQLEQVLLHPGVPDAEGAVTVYVLLIPGGGDRPCAAGTPLAARLHRLARLWGDVVWGPFPLHGLESPALAYTFASQLARLSLRLGGLPWRPVPAAVSGAGVAAGVATCSGGRLLDPLYAFTTLDDEEDVCSDCRCGRLAQLPFFLADRLGRLCRARALRRPDGSQQQVVVCLRADFPAAAQEALAAALLSLLSECGVVLAHCRLTPHLLPLCVDETRPGGFPPAGTCLTLASGEHLLYCREAPVGVQAFSGRSAERCTWRRCAPLAVRLSRLEASGSLRPVEGTAVPQLLGQVYRWVCGNPLRTDGSPWPYVLGHAADALRRYYRECCDGLHPGVVCQ